MPKKTLENFQKSDSAVSIIQQSQNLFNFLYCTTYILSLQNRRHTLKKTYAYEYGAQMGQTCYKCDLSFKFVYKIFFTPR